MKKIMSITSILMLLSLNSFASIGNKIANTSEAVQVALATFAQDLSSDQVEAFKGVKAAPNAHGVSVKIYMADNSVVAYGCHRHEDAHPFECHLSE